MPTGAQTAVSLLASLGAASVSRSLGLWALQAGLVVVLVLALALWASGKTFLAIRFKKTLSPLMRMSLLAGLFLETAYRLTHRQQVKHQKHRRFLTGFETAAVATHQVSKSFVVSNIITFEPPVSLGAVRKAVEQLQQRHSILRAAVVPGPWWPTFDTSRESCSVEVQELQCSAEDAAARFFEESFHDKGCVRIGLCGPDMVLTYHHAFLDGASIMTLLEELLSLLHAPVPVVEDAGLARSPRESLPWYYPWWLLLGCSDRAQSWEVQPVLPRVLDCGRWQDQRVKLLRCELDDGFAAVLRAACRVQGTTVAGALGAATLRAVALLSDPGAVHVCRTFVNLRPHCAMPKEVLGAFVGWVDVALEVGGPFWKSAHAWKAGVTELMGERRHLWAAIWPALFQPYSEYLKLIAGEFAKVAEPEVAVGIGLSNRGSFTLQTPSHRVKSVHFVRNQLGLGKDTFQLNACSVNGTLCLTLGYYSPICSDSMAQTLLDRAVKELKQAAEGGVLLEGCSS